MDKYTDSYIEISDKVSVLRNEIVTTIKAILHSKGYSIGDSARTPGTDVKFNIEWDRLIINNYHTDRISTDDLVSYVRSAIHVIPKNL